MDTLQNILDDMKIDTIDFAKIDVKEFEYETILGSKQLFIDQRIKRITLEIHYYDLEARDLNSDDIDGFLRAYGYRISKQHSWWFIETEKAN